MIRFWLVILRIISGIQLVIAVFKGFSSLIGLLQDGEFIYFFQVASFAFIAALPVQVFLIISNNFPDKPIEGKQKKNFNRLFLLNFLLIAFLFGFIFYDYKEAISLSDSLGTPYPVFFINFFISVMMLVFHFCILFGLYWLRNHINLHADPQQFDFEMQNENS